MDWVVIYNICGISGREKLERYMESINHLLQQDLPGMRICVSSCRSTPATLKILKDHFGSRVSWCRTDELRTVNVTFNLAVKKMMEHFFARAEGYIYSDSGVICRDPRTLRGLVQEHQGNHNAMTAGAVDSDRGFDIWYPGLSEEQIYQGHRLTLRPGKTVNLHLQIFSNKLGNAYGRLLPDIFASHCTESIFFYLCAALGMNFTDWREYRAEHAMGWDMDGGSSGFPQVEGKPNWQHLLPEAPRSMLEILADPAMAQCGMGYEEWCGVKPHDPAKFDHNGHAIAQLRMRQFIEDNFFLPTDRLDYGKIQCEFEP